MKHISFPSVFLFPFTKGDISLQEFISLSSCLLDCYLEIEPNFNQETLGIDTMDSSCM